MSLAFALLAFQAAIPWTSEYFVTQDGPSHVYNAAVLQSLLFDSTSPYAAFYEVHKAPIPNWTSTLALLALNLAVGVDYAEQVLASLCFVAGFFAFSYAQKTIAPHATPWTPVANALLTVWVFWMGFYAFHAGFAICFAAIGYLLRHRRAWRWRNTIVLAAVLVTAYFTHVIPAALALAAVASIGAWTVIVAPAIVMGPRAGRRIKRGVRLLGHLFAALVPAMALLVLYFFTSPYDFYERVPVAQSLREFPLHTFEISVGRSGKQDLLMAALLCFLAVGILSLSRREWLSPRGALAVFTLAVFALYLLLPDGGMGGSHVKVRMAWAVFLFGCLVACSAHRLRAFHAPFGVYVGILLLSTLVTVTKANASASRAASVYLAATANLPDGSKFIRLRAQSPTIRERYGLSEWQLDFFYHLEAYTAARKKAVDFSNYEALTRTFPIVFRPTVDDLTLDALWNLDAPERTGVKIKQLLEKLPLDHVLLAGEWDASNVSSRFAAIELELLRRMRLERTAGAPPFVRIYGLLP